MTIWHVMKTYNENGVYYQAIPYDVRVICELLRSEKGIQQVISFLKISCWTKRKAHRLVEEKNKNQVI